MNKIVAKQQLSPNVVQFEVEAPLIARARRAGHFVIVRVGANGERIPLTIAAADTTRGTITLVVQRVGVSSEKLCNLTVGDEITDLVGPLGKATPIKNFGTVLCACGGVGAAPMLPIAQALKQAGNHIITILAARNRELVILEKELRQCSDEILIMTDDGSYGTKGLITDGIETIVQREHIDKCITIGPAVMMKFVALLTKKYSIPTDASLNTIMVDGTGMCGACRISVDGETRFVCVDGPEFDAHKVNFDEMLIRLKSYKPEEQETTAQWHAAATAQTENTRDAAWRTTLRRSMKPSERGAIERVQMPQLQPEYRITTRTEEVNCGLTIQQALTEAKRCLDCAHPTCVEGCPVDIDIPGFIKNIERHEFTEAAQVIKRSSTLPAVCGRVCPQEKQCESRCIHLKMGHKSVAIGYLERFVADYEREHGTTISPVVAAPNGKKVAVVGSGPAGLAFAGDMAQWGYDVTVFEALHEIGGVLKYGIPEFRLPNRIVDAEINQLRRMGVRFCPNTIIGKTITINQLQDSGYSGIFVASGAGLPRFMNIAGENLNGVLSSNEYLTRINLMDAANPQADTPVLHGRNVAVIGGGNTAMDAVRTAVRLGAERAMIVYRRSEAEMPARIEEVQHAKEEGVEFLTLHTPIEYIGDSEGHVRQMRLQTMRLGEPDASGRRTPVPIDGAIKVIDTDLVIVSVGVSPNPLIPNTTKGLEISPRHTIIVNETTMQSSLPTVYAGGDIVRGGATVILAMSDGRRAAAGMHKMLTNNA